MKFTRILSLVLVALLLCACLASCTFVEGFKSMFGIGTQQPVNDGADEVSANQEYKIVSNGYVGSYTLYNADGEEQTLVGGNTRQGLRRLQACGW